MGEKPAAEKSYGARAGGFNDRNKERTHDGARPARSFSDRPSFGDRTNAERPARNAERFGGQNNDSASPSREVDGNSRSYTKDTDMQFARALSKDNGNKGFAGKSNGDRSSAPKTYARKPEGAYAGRSDSPRSGAPRSSAPRSSAPRSDAPRATTAEKFGNPRPQRASTDRATGDRNGTNRPTGDGAPKRPRSFA